jgi:FKBP-type peptidyl-prolyl cis-trans isomerase SlpA
MSVINENSSVKVHYTGRLTDNTVFDSSVDRKPLEVKLGEGKLIPGFEKGLYGLSAGEKTTIKIQASDAYGNIVEERIQEVEKQYVPETVFAGQQLTAETPEGPITVVVKEIKEATVVLDGNHPLAGKDLIFDLEVIEVVQ